MFYSLGRVGEKDIERLVRNGALPPSAIDVERQRAVIGIPGLPDVALDFLAHGNEDATYGAVCRLEIERRAAMRA